MPQTLNGHCHCRAVEFEVQFEGEVKFGLRCNCSLCRRKGALMVPVPVEQLKVVKGRENLSLYQWGSKKAKHYFCKTCGIYTHHQRFINPKEFCFNVGCVDGISIDSLKVEYVNGAGI